MSDEEKAARRRLEPAQRRAELVEAAARAFSASPYDDVTMAGMASDAGASEALAFRYFPGKAALYAEVVRESLMRLRDAQDAALADAGPGQPAMAQLRLMTRIFVDFVGDNPYNWSARGGPGEPPEALAIRSQARQASIEALRDMLEQSTTQRHEFAMWGFLGFVDAACAQWVVRGCYSDERDALVETCLGALEGALGDWGA